MLEDDLDDILRKACKGNAIPQHSLPSTLPKSLNNLTEIAGRLNLNAQALHDLEIPFNQISLPSEVKKITTKFGHLGVNLFVIKTSERTYQIDTGTELEKVKEITQEFSPNILLITHDHYDHSQFSSTLDIPTFFPGNSIDDLPNEIITFDVSGHCTPSLAYYFPNLSKPVCFMGDALFKRSMGGCHTTESYKDGISNVKKLLSTLPKETILCVGHGPCSTVKAELKENPFFAE